MRDLEEHFESRVLPLFAKRTRQVRELIPELYLHGLALGDFDLALRGLLGEKAHLSSSTVARLKEQWQAEWEVWQSRPLNDLEVVYLWVDGIYVKAGLEKEKAVLLDQSGSDRHSESVGGLRNYIQHGSRGSDSKGARAHAKGRYRDSLAVGDHPVDPRFRSGTCRKD